MAALEIEIDRIDEPKAEPLLIVNGHHTFVAPVDGIVNVSTAVSPVVSEHRLIVKPPKVPLA